MVRADPSEQTGIPDVSREPFRNLSQQGITGQSPQTVIDVLETLQVDQAHR